MDLQIRVAGHWSDCCQRSGAARWSQLQQAMQQASYILLPGQTGYIVRAKNIRTGLSPVQDLLLPTIHIAAEFAASPLQGRPPMHRHILAFFRGEMGNHRWAVLGFIVRMHGLMFIPELQFSIARPRPL